MAALAGSPRLVVLRALGLGDLLTALPALRALADAFPDHCLLLAAPRELGPLARLSGVVDEIVDARPLEPLPDVLHGVELAVDLHGRGPESHRVLRRLEPGRLIAFANRAGGVPSGPRWRDDEHETARWCRLLEESGIAADASRLDLDPPPLRLPERWRGVTIVHPGAAAAARRWPPERFAAVVRSERALGRSVAITGSRAELSLAREVARLAGIDGVAVLAGRTGLRDLVALVAAAGRVVCGDTGIAHLATALRTPSVVLFGPLSPDRWGPPPDRPWHRSIWAGRSGDPHATAPARGLLAIEVAEVVDALASLPDAVPVAA